MKRLNLTPEEQAQRRKAASAATAAWQKANPERHRANQKRWEEAHREEERERSRKRREADPEKARTASRISQQRRREKDPEGVKARKSAWDKAHPENQHNYRRQRRARKANAPQNTLTREQELLVIAAAKGRCPYCPHYDPTCKDCKKGTHVLEIEHITALVKNGPNTLWNIVACCHSCNAKKHTGVAPVLVQPFLL